VLGGCRSALIGVVAKIAMGVNPYTAIGEVSRANLSYNVVPHLSTTPMGKILWWAEGNH
jgi:hypothetical protein